MPGEERNSRRLRFETGLLLEKRCEIPVANRAHEPARAGRADFQSISISRNRRSLREFSTSEGNRRDAMGAEILRGPFFSAFIASLRFYRFFILVAAPLRCIADLHSAASWSVFLKWVAWATRLLRPATRRPGLRRAASRTGRPHWFEPLLPFRPASRRTAQVGRLCYPETIFQTPSWRIRHA